MKVVFFWPHLKSSYFIIAIHQDLIGCLRFCTCSVAPAVYF